jgi:DHA2 family multidrug resistance protein
MLLARVLQGIGGGGLAPVEQAILVDTFPPAKRASAFALYTIAIVTAPAIGPVLGGWITDNFNWRWVFLINIPIGFLSLYLTSRFVHDTPEFTAERKFVRDESGHLRVDAVGIGLLGIGSAALEIVLDRGQIDDWFGSRTITWLFFIAIVCLGTAVFWELNQKDPVIEFRLLRSRNFALANLFYFVFGVGLFASTTMIPQILQSLYGYRAIDAGLVLGPGAFVITMLAPVGAQLVQRGIIAPRYLLTIAVVIVGISFLHYSNFTLQTDYSHYAWARALQGLGYAFFFVPLSVIAYSQLKPGENNKASSLTNFFRNWGGSFGIAFMSTITDRRQSFHQSVVGGNLAAPGPWVQQQVKEASSFLQTHGYSAADALNMAYGRVYNELHAQTQMLAFMDCFRIIGIMTLCAAPLVLLTKRFRIGGGPSGGH